MISRKHHLGALIGGLALLASVAANPLAASAATPDSASTVSAPMSVDCSSITAAGLSYLKAHNVNACGVGGSLVHPNATGTASGDCGVTSITIDNLGGGKAHIRWGASSKIGPITERALDPEWYNETTDKSGSTIDLFPMASPTYVSAWWSPTTGRGTVYAELKGQIVIDGIVNCDVYNPEAHTTIS